ncbi:hypothetical protein OGZ02_11425 [Brachyspira hyodysenteriae]|nr:hypothetical protein [Brachyspira hyodysenteriae]
MIGPSGAGKSSLLREYYTDRRGRLRRGLYR